MSKKIQNKNKYNKADNSKKEPIKAPKWFYAVPFLLPIVFFILLEVLLRVFGYGIEYKQWLDVTSEIRIMNPEYTRKYFHTTTAVPYPNGNFFDVVKAPNAFRVFILGESSAAGYPFTPNGDFGKYIRKRLELDYPDRKIEVVNLGITAVNTFTIRDLMPGILEQKPDLLLIYTGHNEYYGALGAGSVESFGSSRFIVNSTIWLEQFRTVQLIRNVIKGVVGWFSTPGESKSGTLMSRMAKNQYIEYNSDVFNKGMEQFEGNINDILQMAGNNGTKVIISTLASNLKDQFPFVSVKGKYPEASAIYKSALAALQSDPAKANSLFRLAKDLDALRFRAPEIMNRMIKSFAVKYNIPLVNADSVFAYFSPANITGDNLMTDHLHPTIQGYQLLGKAFYEVIIRSGILPKPQSQLSDDQKDSYVKDHYNFSRLDSVIARYRLALLKNDWPFTSRPIPVNQLIASLKPSGFLDTIAIDVTDRRRDWEEAHRIAAQHYLSSGDYAGYTEETLALADQYPFITRYYNGVNLLLENKQYDYAYELLLKKYRVYPDAFTAKWIGMISLNKGNSANAVKYLNISADYSNNDPQVFYNLAGAYALQKDFSSALKAVNNCLKINPSFEGAADLKNQLTAINNNK